MTRLIICLLFFQSLIVHGQEKPLNKERWDDLKQSVEFVHGGKSKNTEENDKDGSGDRRLLDDDSSSTNQSINLGPLVQLVLIILFILFIAALLYALISNAGLTKKPELTNMEMVEFEMEEKKLTKSELEKWLESALDAKDYKLAMRIYFLIALKGLERQKLIRWQKEKTNWHYIQELDKHHLQAPFKALVYEYDLLWYGEKGYSSDLLKEKLDQFKSFRILLDTKS